MYPMTSGGQLVTTDEKQMGLLLHLSQLLGVTIMPVLGLLAPIIIWQLKKDSSAGLDAHGKMITNWIISSTIYWSIAWILAWALIGFLAFPVLWLLGIIFPVIGAIKANQGYLWHYPLTIKFLK